MLIELIPPALAGLNAIVGVEVEKLRAEALLLGPLLLLILQPITDPRGPGVVVAAVADEDGAHDAVAEAASGQITWAALTWLLMDYRGSGDLPNAPVQRRRGCAVRWNRGVRRSASRHKNAAETRSHIQASAPTRKVSPVSTVTPRVAQVPVMAL